MSGERASERLKVLHAALADDWQEPTVTFWAALPEIIALVEAAEEIYEDFAKLNPPDLLPRPIQKIGSAREDLRAKLSGEGQG